MIQTIELTNEEKYAMYKKCTKDELIKMLIENQNLLKIVSPPTVGYIPSISTYDHGVVLGKY